MSRYRKKPFEVEAEQFWAGDVALGERIERWSLGRVVMVGNRENAEQEWRPICASIDTLEGKMTALSGNWIIRGVKGEFYPCKPDIFEATYEPA